MEDDNIEGFNDDGKLTKGERIIFKLTSGKFIMVVISTIIFNLGFFFGRISGEQYIAIYTIMVSYYFTKSAITQSNAIDRTDNLLAKLSELETKFNFFANTNIANEAKVIETEPKIDIENANKEQEISKVQSNMHP